MAFTCRIFGYVKVILTLNVRVSAIGQDNVLASLLVCLIGQDNIVVCLIGQDNVLISFIGQSDVLICLIGRGNILVSVNDQDIVY